MGTIERTTPEPGLMAFTVVGEVTIEQLAEAHQECSEKPPGRILWDVTQGSLRPVRTAQVRDLLGRLWPFSRSREGGRTAPLLSSDVDFGAGCRAAAIAEGRVVDRLAVRA